MVQSNDKVLSVEGIRRRFKTDRRLIWSAIIGIIVLALSLAAVSFFVAENARDIATHAKHKNDQQQKVIERLIHERIVRVKIPGGGTARVKIIPGPRGARGPQGSQGIPGTAAQRGAQGPQGPSGTPGARGPQGPQGPRGASGPQGPIGPIGPVGPTPSIGEIVNAVCARTPIC